MVYAGKGEVREEKESKVGSDHACSKSQKYKARSIHEGGTSAWTSPFRIIRKKKYADE